jgi:hypothetical protein
VSRSSGGRRFVLLGIVLLAGGFEVGDERDTGVGRMLLLSGLVCVCLAVVVDAAE